MNYYKITENCDWEGESWDFYLKEEGNEKFIDKLKKTIEKLEDYDGIEVAEELVPEFEVDVLVKHSKSGYLDFVNKVDKVISPTIIKTKNFDAFKQSYYKGSYFG